MHKNKWIHRFVLLLITAILWQTWILLVDGSLWNSNMLVYVMGILIFNAVRKTEFHIRGGALPIFGTVGFAVISALLFYAGVKVGGISGNVIISHLCLKSVFILAGSFLTFQFWLGMKKSADRKRRIAIVLLTVGAAFAFHIQGIINIRSLAGWSMVIWMIPVITEGKNANNHITKMFPFRNAREKAGVILLASMFSCFSVLGEWNNIGQRIGTDRISFRFILVLLYIFLIWLFFLAAGVLVFVRLLDRVSVKRSEKKGEAEGVKFVLLCWGSMIFFWMPYFLTWFPGMLSHDSITQLEQAMGELAYSNHHPWIHTLLIQGCVRIGMLHGKNINTGVAIYSIFSILFLSFVCSLMIWRIRKKLAPIWMQAVLWCFYALCPIQGAYATTMWKDIIFSGIVLLFLLTLDSVTEQYSKVKTASWLLFILTGTGVCLLRSNGLYAWLFLLLFLSVFFVNRKGRVKFGIAVIGVLLLVVGYKMILLPAFEVSEPDLIESLSIPAQQIACVLAKGGNITEEEQLLLGEIVDLEKAKSGYVDYISDPIKNLVRQKGNQNYMKENMGLYVKCWLNIGIRNLYYYVGAFVSQTRGYWYHKVDNWIFYFEGVRENTLGIERLSALPGFICEAVEAGMRVSEAVFHKYFSIAMSSWLLLLGMIYGWMKKRKWLLYILPLGIVLSLLAATPVCAEFRYVYSNFLAAPAIFFITLCENDVGKDLGEMQ